MLPFGLEFPSDRTKEKRGAGHGQNWGERTAKKGRTAGRGVCGACVRWACALLPMTCAIHTAVSVKTVLFTLHKCPQNYTKSAKIKKLAVKSWEA